MSNPSLTRTPSALEHVCLAWPYSWLSVVIDGVAVPGGYFPALIALRKTPASWTYALGSDSSPIDILVPYSIGKVANRNASTVVDCRRERSLTGTLSRMYLWELVGHDTSEGVLLSGIDDDLASVMRAGGALLEQRRGFSVRIVGVVS